MTITIGSGNAEETLEGLCIMLIAFAVFALIFVLVINGIRNSKNSRQPMLTKTAKVLDVPSGDGMLFVMVLFELEDGRRIRLRAKPINSLVAGDCGKLTYQGDQILRFIRTPAGESSSAKPSRCPNCDTAISANTRICPGCGRSL